MANRASQLQQSAASESDAESDNEETSAEVRIL